MNIQFNIHNHGGEQTPDYRIHVEFDGIGMRHEIDGAHIVFPDPEGIRKPTTRQQFRDMANATGWKTPEGAAAALQRAIQDAVGR